MSDDPRPSREPKTSLMRNLGAFVGHIAVALRTDVSRERREVKRTTTERSQDGMILRRTTIEEIELPREHD